jgi:Replication-relaxation
MFRLTERDKALIAKCGICRWVTTSQIQRLYFPGASMNAVQKRLRKLSDEGFLRAYREDLLSEAVHAVGPKGRTVAEERGIEVRIGNEIPRQLEHLRGVNDIRIAVETAVVRVAYFFAYWQLANLGWIHSVIPDAIFAIRLPERRRFAVEYDRLTEGLEVLVSKLASYSDGIPGFSLESVLIVTERDRRLDLLAREMRKRQVAVRVFATTLAELQATNMFDCLFVEIPRGVQRKILEFAEDGGDETAEGD